LWPFWCSLVCHFQGIAKLFFKSMWLAPNIRIVHNILPCITLWKNVILWAWEYENARWCIISYVDIGNEFLFVEA
jgi:hypothetical protein